jgi:DNA-binding NarL/FixJ family response regulator
MTDMNISNQPVSPGSGNVAPLFSDRLTAREQEILRLLAQGYVTKEIACQLAISFDTVRFHLKNIYRKLSVRTRSEAIVRFLQEDWNQRAPMLALKSVR